MTFLIARRRGRSGCQPKVDSSGIVSVDRDGVTALRPFAQVTVFRIALIGRIAIKVGCSADGTTNAPRVRWALDRLDGCCAEMVFP
ncbi:hypothetical protein ACWKSP_30620 [Micromonosporaceae bacterium Da 78-11]